MTPPTIADTASRPGGPPRVLAYDDFLRRQREALDAERAAARARLDADREAFRRYQLSLRALPPQPRRSAAVAVDDAHVLPQAPWQPAPSDELTDHNYDGIQEYDNPTPGWWHMLFVGSVVFSVLYIFVYHMSGLVPSLPRRLAAAEAASVEQRFAELNQIPMSEAKILTIMNQPAWLDQGASIFQATCAVCHGKDGSGGVGPNLTDDNYKNIASLMDIPAFIREGSPNGAMPPQRNTMNDNEIALVAAFAASLRGHDLPDADLVKPEYEGVAIPPWPALDDDGNVIPARAAQARAAAD